jgi:hypothetical protein
MWYLTNNPRLTMLPVQGMAAIRELPLTAAGNIRRQPSALLRQCIRKVEMAFYHS